MANIKVAVRVRPISARELNFTGSEVVVRTDLTEVSLTNLKVSSSKAGDSRERTRRYGFDYCFDSSDSEAERYADQGKIYATLGPSVLDAVFSGYNSCLVAYGQSASGKTYTMMGTKDDPGLTPRLCEGLFSRIEEERKSERIYRVSVSYLEIYNERVRDLLKPASSTSGGLRVREHPRLGPYVQGLTHHVVRNLGSLMSYVEEGTKARKTASTLQNPSSSRSHALLTVSVSPEASSVVHPGVSSSKASPRGGSKLHLVDLAGSESAATCGGVHRLKEGANINKSLVALGNVISALAERGPTGTGPGRRFIPYRDSSLTWLLKDALGGNATTIMLATISPASGSYNETAHTLRFAQRAQSVVNRPVVNENPVARIIRELRAEVARLKALLLEKNVEPERSKSPCSCKKVAEENHDAIPAADGKEVERFDSTESVEAPYETVKRFDYEFLSKHRFANYNCAKVTELNDEEDEINESVFVDIPTLVAVLIKPDDSLQDTQIEEICSDEVAEDSIDVEFLEAGDDRLFDDLEKPDHHESSGSVNFYNASDGDASHSSIPQARTKNKLLKQDSIDMVTPSNLQTSKRFGSVETIQKKKEPLFPFERSQTNLEKRPAVPDRAKKLNNIREIEDQRVGKVASVWRATDVAGSKDRLQRKGSNDSDKSLKDSNSGTRSKNYARKPSLENLKRKTSKDSSSSSSKDEQILISSSTRDKLLSRKSSLEQEPGSFRAHTPIQRAKRAEIVAAVTQRLYASRKPPEDNATGIRSPPEPDAKSVYSSKTKLQEFSRKMLGKRRRVCVDTQTDDSHTVRVKDTASLTDEPETVVVQDVGVLTDDHEDCEVADHRLPVLRVKEIGTLTEKPKTTIVRSKDVGSLANDLDDFDYAIHSPRDSGILSDDTQNYAESNLSSAEASDLCPEKVYAETSTNTRLFSPSRSSQTAARQVVARQETKTASCLRPCCNSVPETGTATEKNVISISLPDMISITIESANVFESRIAVVDGADVPEERAKYSTRDGEAQTEEPVTRFSFKDFSRSTVSQTDGRVFRIENIFQDPKTVSRSQKDSAEQRDKRVRNSVTFTNSLGTSPDGLTEDQPGDSYRDGSITEAFITKKRSLISACERRQNVQKVPRSTDDPERSAARELACASPSQANEVPSSIALPCARCSSPVYREGQDQSLSEAQQVTESSVSAMSEHDYNFSDDSLDYNESNATKTDDTETRESFCPPDVVAHTKKEVKSGNAESEATDFDDSQVDFPKKKPNDCPASVHDYTSLILGKPPYVIESVDEAADTATTSVRSKKKVSFSNFSVAGERQTEGKQSPLKSIIKRKKKKPAQTEPANAVESNEETDDSLQDGPECRDWRTRSASSEEANSNDSQDSNDEWVDFPQEKARGDQPARNMLQEYLDEAVTFMRNVNSINEFMSATRTFEKPLGRRRRGNRRRVWNRDYVEFEGRRISLKDDSDDYLEADDVAVPTESCDRCLNGIRRVENCIRRVDEQNKLLRERYGIECESAAARLTLASSSLDLRGSATESATRRPEVALTDVATTGSLDAEENETDEKRIFDQLMNAVRTTRCERKVRPGLLGSQCSTGYSKFPEKFCQRGRDTFCRDFRGIYNFDESFADGNDRLREFERDFESTPEGVDFYARKFATGESYKFDEPTNCQSIEDVTGSEIKHFRDKLKYPGSPRARFLELLRERRRIVESSRGTTAS